MTTKVDYPRYLASREWREKRKEVIERNDGLCYRCLSAPIQDVHHVTYERIGHEDLDDLIGVCKPCHEYLSAERTDDPAIKVLLSILTQEICLSAPDAFGLRSNWVTKDLPNGRHFFIDFCTTPDIDEDLPWTAVVPMKPGIWLHCYWT